MEITKQTKVNSTEITILETKKGKQCSYYLFNGQPDGTFKVITTNDGQVIDTQVYEDTDVILWQSEKRSKSSNQTTRLISNALSSRVSAVRRYIGHHVMKLLNLRG